MRRGLRWWLGAVLVAATTVSGSTHSADALGPQINGGGSSFAKLEVDQWRAEVARHPYDLDVNYVAQGSTFGRQQYSTGALDFAVSDTPFLPNELAGIQLTPRSEFRYVPVSAAGVGFMYHLFDVAGQQVNALNLSARTACRIFTDPTLFWDDSELQALNPSLALPHAGIKAIVRADGAGTSYALSQYCIAAAGDVWTAFVAAHRNNPNADPELALGHPILHWPTTTFGSAVAPDGVAAAVADSSGMYSITYNEAGFARVRGFPNASLQNASGNYVQPTGEAVTLSLASATGNSDGTFTLDYEAPSPSAYPLAMYSYAIAQTTGFDPSKGEVLARFLCYAVTRGQRIELTTLLGYAALSPALVDVARNSIAQIPGAPPWEQCAVIDPSPPAEIPEAPWTPLFIVSAALVIGAAYYSQRRPSAGRWPTGSTR